MYPYILLIFIPAAVAIYALAKMQSVPKSNRSYYFEHNLVLPVFFTLLILMLMLRHESIGRDLDAYKYYFQTHHTYKFSEVVTEFRESLFKSFNWILGKITDDFQIYIIITSLLSVLPIAWIYCKDRTNSFLKIILFVNMSTFVMLFSGIRQALAMAVGMIAYYFVKNKKLIWFIAMGLLAMMLHHSGFMIFLMYPLYYLKIKKQYLFLAFPIFPLIFALRGPIFNLITAILSSSLDKYDVKAESGNAFMMFLLFLIFAVFCYVICDDSRMDAETNGLRNFLAFSVFLQIFASVNPLAMRMNYYFILFIPIAISKCLDCCKKNMLNVARLGKVVIVVFFTCYYLYTTYVACKTGISALDTFPYRFFWENRVVYL